MTISAFFAGLGAPLRATRWSWGALDGQGRVVLRGWKDRIEPTLDGGRRIKILDRSETPRTSHPGYNERCRHLAAIREGAEGFVVVVTARDAHSSPRTIESFESGKLLRLSNIEDVDGNQWGIIDGEIPTANFRAEALSGV